MFVRNAWYCAGWDYHLSQGQKSLLARKIAGERVVLYRKPDGGVVAMEDRCCHRGAALSLGQKEGDCVRCMYHGLKFGPDGVCVEIPGQDTIGRRARVRTFPVVEKNNWIWVWMGDPDKADEDLICFSVGPGNPDWNIKTSEMRINANYRLEMENLADLSHVAFVHQQTLGGADLETRRGWTEVNAIHTVLERGLNTKYCIRNVPVFHVLTHLFPPEARFDLEFDINITIPLNWVTHIKVYPAGTEGVGRQLISETYTVQTVCPEDEDGVQYYYSWGESKATDFPGVSDLLRETLDKAFVEDKTMLEAQHVRRAEKPDAPMINIAVDAGPNKMLGVLDKMLREEREEREAIARVA
ncbi:MAG: aromatic ring-hydroxylating dioxygenase subunit alpha [Nevskiaceae bacterium]|nr:MAG: aromatic ring-hydroxylating dioxygenase subunit alpha [Nevskiaceae bacterium]TBR72810.1 MAG: aromatic ring-hydroxylating dioxygenase subunit alpha [Nevskiaceae bacterium]